MPAVNEDTLIKLLRVEPESQFVIASCTGWPLRETMEALERLRRRGVVSYNNWQGGDRKYFLTGKAAS